MCAVGTCGLQGWAMTETPAAQKRGSSSAPGICAANSGREGAVDDRAMRAHLLEQPSAQDRHAPAAARRAARVRARPGLDREAAGLARLRNAGERVLERLHRRHDPRLQRLEPACDHARGAGRRESGRRLARHRPRTRATRRSTCAIGVSGRMPWPRLKICARGLEALEHAVDFLVESGAARRPAPADRDCPARRSARAGRRMRRRARRRCRGRPQRCRRSPREFPELGGRAARKGDDRRMRRRARALSRSARRSVSTHQRSNSAGGSTPAQESKICTASAPAASCRSEILGRSVDEAVDQRGEKLRMPIGEEPRRRLIRRAAPGDHVARHCPRRAAEADQRDIAGQERLQPVERLEHRRELCPVGLVAKPRQARRVLDRSRGAGLRRSRTRRVCPSASGTTRMSENRIAASKPKRRIGCSVASTVKAGV